MFNTLNYAKKLEGAGISRNQAEAHVQVIAEIIEDDLVTKQDLINLENRLIIKLSAIGGSMLSIAVAVIVALLKVK